MAAEYSKEFEQYWAERGEKVKQEAYSIPQW